MSYLFLLLTLGGCASTVNHVDPLTVAAAVDFTPYTRRGFLFTTETYPGPYEAVGIISVTRYAGGHRVPGVTTDYVWQFDPVPVAEVLDSMYARATALHADALTKFTLRTVTRPGPGTDVPGIEVSGFAIRRLDKR